MKPKKKKLVHNLGAKREVLVETQHRPTAELKILEKVAAEAAQRVAQALRTHDALGESRVNWEGNLEDALGRFIAAKLGAKRPVALKGAETAERLAELFRQGDFYLVDALNRPAGCLRMINEQQGQLGFGPLITLVSAGRIEACAFYNLPQRTLFSAQKDSGAYALCAAPQDCSAAEPKRRRLSAADSQAMDRAGVLFFPGASAECRIVEHLKGARLVENAYRFGGFASDCSRLALGHEQILLQLTVKPWELGAALLAAEAGLQVVLDPLGTKTSLFDWEIAAENPLLASAPGMLESFLEVVRERLLNC